MDKDQFDYEEPTFDEAYYNKKRAALVVDDRLPVAVLNLQTLELIGDWEEIPGLSKDDAVVLTRFKDPVLEKYVSLKGHIWVNPEFVGYRDLWKSLGFESPNTEFHLDHVHAKECASAQGYDYVMLLPCPRSPNMSAGPTEKKLKQNVIKGDAVNHPIKYAEGVHWAKMWGILQPKVGKPVSEGKWP